MTSNCIACLAPLDDEVYFRNAVVALYFCPSCRSLTACPRPTLNEQAARHDSAMYFDHPYFTARREPSGTLSRRCEATFTEIGRVTDISALRGSPHLDVGCDTGAFLVAASQLCGTVPVGVDVAARAVAEATRRGIEAYRGSIESLPNQLSNFALITAIDLIEHVTNPDAFLHEVNARLRPGGICYIETPNPLSHIYRWGRRLGRTTGNLPRAVFERLFPAEHIQYFSEAGLRSTASRARLQVVSTWSRILPTSDIAASVPVRAAVSVIQMMDALPQEGLLLCMVAQRPV